MDTALAHVRAAIAVHGGWLELLRRLPPDLAPSAPAVLAALGPKSIEHAGVERSGGVERRLGRAQRGGERLGPLAVIPRPVVAPDGVVVGDGPAGGQDRVGGGALDLRPLLELLAPAGRGQDGVVGGRPVGIDVGEAARHRARRRTRRRAPRAVRSRTSASSRANRSQVTAVSNVSASTPMATKVSRR